MAAGRPKSITTNTRQTEPERLVHRILDRKPPRALPDAGRTPATRKEMLRAALPATVELLHSRQAGKIDASFIEDYVALHWLEWNGGSLQLTITGKNVCAQLASTYA